MTLVCRGEEVPAPLERRSRLIPGQKYEIASQKTLATTWIEELATTYREDTSKAIPCHFGKKSAQRRGVTRNNMEGEGLRGIRM
jgi:hypothetical protein